MNKVVTLLTIIIIFVALLILYIERQYIWDFVKQRSRSDKQSISSNLRKTLSRQTYYSIIIKGDSNCKNKTQMALNLLKKEAIFYYDNIRKYIGIIECVPKGSGMYAYEKPPRYQVGENTYNADTLWYAGTIVHDMCHSKQYNDYSSQYTLSPSVPSEIWMGKTAEAKCLDVQYDALVKIGADQDTLTYIKKVIETEYWSIPVTERNW